LVAVKPLDIFRSFMSPSRMLLQSGLPPSLERALKTSEPSYVVVSCVHRFQMSAQIRSVYGLVQTLLAFVILVVFVLTSTASSLHMF
jgi:hypothetical protein